ncbi:MAG: nucleotidyltransferase domain-containing protein, partial [Armatimonadetes bacterium]|nr:nucleotidyltransferase domain-containing protein [Armatimonadota bacterium]
MQDSNSVQARFQAALEALIEKVRCDPTILAAVLMGSLAHDRVWEKSDIDLLLVTQEGKLRQRSFSLVENGVTIHAYLETRSEFRKTMEGSRQGSEVLHYRSRLLFSRDESLQELFENRNRVGTRDQSAGILSTAQWLMATLTKTEKWLFARGDLDYCLYWILRCVDLLATIVVLRHGETPGRKALHQARRYEPELVEYLFHGVIHGDRDAPSLEAALTR